MIILLSLLKKDHFLKKVDEHDPRICMKRSGSPMVEYVNNEIIFIVEESPEGGYEARSLNYSIFTEADTFEELKGMVHDAVSCHFKTGDRPRLIRLHQVKEELMTV